MSIITHDGKKIVVAVKANGPALRAGMQRGDELITVAGKDASAIDMFELRQTLTYKPGREIVIEVRRGTSTRSIAVELAEINAY